MRLGGGLEHTDRPTLFFLSTTTARRLTRLRVFRRYNKREEPIRNQQPNPLLNALSNHQTICRHIDSYSLRRGKYQDHLVEMLR
jgi:hypothetical protein